MVCISWLLCDLLCRMRLRKKKWGILPGTVYLDDQLFDIHINVGQHREMEMYVEPLKGQCISKQ